MADLLSFSEIKRLADAVKQKYYHLDALINNAGAQFTDTREIASEGHEKTMMINSIEGVHQHWVDIRFMIWGFWSNLELIF